MGKAIDEEFLQKIAARIKQVREKHAITQEVFYNDTGINIGRIERAKRDFSMSTLKRICNYFKISPSEFLNGLD